ncbi:hypothetical protein QCE73_37070 [Caballeronia sp. LZ029]|uniref:hypothetical protein n=1 Tax=Caballeronia sp. LZ029 TaxID=3038564 RepID=UPI0028639021|nr:hypothetical protein [Caballeronia sp. LZ029]MDR5748796.1 hypothetical protein [Caballeronia sp. LZ029]
MMRYLLVLALLCAAVSTYAGDSHDQGAGRHGGERQGPKVYDAQGKYVGLLVGSASGDGVYLTINGAATFVGINRVSDNTTASATQFQWWGGNFAAYASSDCSGPAIIQSYDALGRPSTAVRVGTDVVLYVAGGADSTTLQARSQRVPRNLDVLCASLDVQFDRVFATEATYPLSQEYPEPLTIRP